MSHKMPQKLITGTFLAVQWLSHWITLKDEWVQSLLEKLRSCMLWGAVKKKDYYKVSETNFKVENFTKDVKEPNESYKTENYHNQNKKSIKYTQE